MQSFSIKKSSNYEKYEPQFLTNPIPYMLLANELSRRRSIALADAYESLGRSYELYLWRTRSNNWLKMHGYPMRRRYPK